MGLVDVPLHFNFYAASHGGGGYDMRNILKGTLLEARPDSAELIEPFTVARADLRAFLDANQLPIGTRCQLRVRSWSGNLCRPMVRSWCRATIT